MESLNLNEREDKLVVGIDFGTTYSGIAWATARHGSDIILINEWPSHNPESNGTDKVATEIRYTPEGIEWGYQIPPTVQRHQWFKLDIGNRQLAGLGQPKTAKELASDYMRELYRHLMCMLRRTFEADVLSTLTLEFCLTVPAIWQEAEKEATLQAFRSSGVGRDANVLLASEPEAAAIYTLKALNRHNLNVGDTFVLCDAGGGTVDLISYTITALQPQLTVKEATAGTGGRYGSTFLNRRFAEMVVQNLGNLPGWNEDILPTMTDRFETLVKRIYAPRTEPYYTFAAPGLGKNPAMGIRQQGRYTVTSAELETTVFSPIVTEIVTLVKNQIQAARTEVKAVLLVGGFGQNDYLRESLRSNIGGVAVLRPDNGWTAVVRGAVMMGLSGADVALTSVGIESRVARKHYGFELNTPFQARKHMESKRYWCSIWRQFRTNYMKWFIRKGDEVEENDPRSFSFVCDYLVANGIPTGFTMDVEHDQETEYAPVHRVGTVRSLLTLRGDLRQLPISEWESMIVTRPDGKEYYCLRCAIEVTFYSANTKYVLLSQGKRYDAVTAEYV
ncbi:hypothetical protein LZ554_008106 [Drepanopeziza brunnea f. sp. 'monogermtubi']|nr:hypothetical protein LZ554_008106 [Drepanopeziza brunnea f. sp. 'monogermtubi']